MWLGCFLLPFLIAACYLQMLLLCSADPFCQLQNPNKKSTLNRRKKINLTGKIHQARSITQRSRACRGWVEGRVEKLEPNWPPHALQRRGKIATRRQHRLQQEEHRGGVEEISDATMWGGGRSNCLRFDELYRATQPAAAAAKAAAMGKKRRPGAGAEE